MKTLSKVGSDYMTFLNGIGSDLLASHEEAVTLLCAPHCRKIVNGSLWFEGRENVLSQLLKTGKKIGHWKIEPQDVIIGQDGKTVVVHFLVHTEKVGSWSTLVILRCTKELLIEEIDEVFNSYEGLTR